jgi:hypothetical protein
MDIYRELGIPAHPTQRYLTVVVELGYYAVMDILQQHVALDHGIKKKQVEVNSMDGNGGKRTQVRIPLYLADFSGIGKVLYDLDDKEANDPR